MREQAKNKYRELSDEKININRKHGRNKYQNMSEENKQILKEYPKKYREDKKINKKSFTFFFFTRYKNITKSFNFW